MMIFHLLSTQGGVQEYPYFSQDVTTGAKEDRALNIVNRHKTTNNMVFTFDPASVKTLNEYIWIDHE